MIMDQTLQYCADKFGVPPRKFSVFARWGYLRIPYPEWVVDNEDDPILMLWGGMKRLRREGIITWGHVVQANELLFEKGLEDHPGELVYSIKGDSHGDPDELARVAGELFELKGSMPDSPELAPIAAYLTDELTRAFGIDIPSVVSPNLQCQVSSAMFVRKHLPGGVLNKSLMPILVLPDDPQIAMPLPSRYWPEDFVEWWLE